MIIRNVFDYFLIRYIKNIANEFIFIAIIKEYSRKRTLLFFIINAIFVVVDFSIAFEQAI